MSKKLALLLVIASLVGSLSSCSEKPEDVPLVPALSEKEVVDYYKDSMSYDRVVSRTNKVNEVTYETVDVLDENIKNGIISNVNTIEGLLGRDKIIETDGMNPNIHQFIKYILDDKRLVRTNILSIKEALGHYFVDIEYSMAPQNTGTFNTNTKYLGIRGAYTEDYITGKIVVDTEFIRNMDTMLNQWLAENPLYQRKYSPVEGVRVSPNDVALINKVVGMSKGDTASMPELEELYAYNPTGVGGYGLFPQGAFTLRDFGYSRQGNTGKAVLRYVFKRDIMDPTKIEFKNVYPTEFNWDNKPLVEENVVIPAFVKEEVNKIVERSDRAICNTDISALVGGSIYDDIGLGVLYGNSIKYVHNQGHISKASEVVGRKDHKYLVEIESTVREGAKDTNAIGTWVYNGYAVVQQEDTEFHITDFVMTDMKMEKEPAIELEDTVLKRLAALNLSGEVTQSAKDGITELMNKLYKGSTERKLNEMYDCFDTDTNLLSSTHREYLNSQLRGFLTKYGVDEYTEYMGVVSQWIGGADNQVELFTTELIDCPRRDKGLYMQNYYLVSCYADKWVIDEMKIVESKDVEGAELGGIREALKNGASANVENPDNNEVR